VFNPNATTTDDHVRDVIAAALASAVDLDVQQTKQRGHATHLVAGAVHDQADAVFALGGDGTANEVLQALAGTDVRLGIIPGGGANVLARSLGLPNDPILATSQLLHAVRTDHTRRIGLGRAGARYFGFNAGFGFDAAVVRHVEQHTRMKRTLRQSAFVWSAAREWAAGARQRDGSIAISLDGSPFLDPVSISMVANTDPYTFLGDRPMHLHPAASFDRGLDLITVGDISTRELVRIAARAFRDGSHVDLDSVGYHHDIRTMVMEAAEPRPLMVDGDYAGEHRKVVFSAVPDALRVLL
jgi:diacylglycerol kinase family enzyme